MKKIYFSVITVLTAFSLNAQQTIGFESFNLLPNSYDNGSISSDPIIENTVVFPRKYNLLYGGFMEKGFAVSNLTDITTSGYTNQYSAITGSGYNSGNYAVYYPDTTINLHGYGLDSLKITNTTYAALSMRDGDFSGKKFGSVNDANGNPDGTNGDDYFRVWIIANNSQGEKLDSTVFYLADFRFANSSDDYIVNTWKNLAIPFNNISIYTLSFRFESSDNGTYGMNTPSYFAIDNLSIKSLAGIDSKELRAISIYPNPMSDKLTIKGSDGLLELFDLSGKLLMSQNHSELSEINVSELASGSYTVKISNENATLVRKMVK